MKKIAFVPLLSLVLLLAAASKAFASAPTIEREPIEGTFVTNVCGFPVRVDTKGYVVHISWVDASGNVRGIDPAPQAKWVLTNLQTGESITVNISGPDQFTFNSDGSFHFVGTGTWGWVRHPDTGVPGLFLTEGRWVAQLDSTGNFSFSRVGNVVDLCAELAP
jgi:hypothetical protein